MNQPRKTRIAVIFGGRSGEHEVSLASARSVMAALDPARFEILPLGITPAGAWLTSGDPLKLLTSAAQSASQASGGGTLTRPGTTALALLHEAENHHEGHPLARADVIFPVLHGPYGEDGTVQGLFELIDVPYVGAGVAASAVGMDKALMKALFAAAGLPQLPYLVLARSTWEREADQFNTGAKTIAQSALLDRVEKALPYPVFVKPANLGSSVGISRADDRTGLVQALSLAARYDRKLIVEQGLCPPGSRAREIELSVLGNEATEVSVAGEIVPHTTHTFYDYEAKYTPGEADLILPADLSPDMLTELQELALRAFQAIDGAGLARVDFLVDPHTSKIYVNELNTMPGFTATSMYARLWEASGLSYPQLLERLIELAIERHQDKQRNQVDRRGL